MNSLWLKKVMWNVNDDKIIAFGVFAIFVLILAANIIVLQEYVRDPNFDQVPEEMYTGLWVILFIVAGTALVVIYRMGQRNYYFKALLLTGVVIWALLPEVILLYSRPGCSNENLERVAYSNAIVSVILSSIILIWILASIVYNRINRGNPQGGTQGGTEGAVITGPTADDKKICEEAGYKEAFRENSKTKCQKFIESTKENLIYYPDTKESSVFGSNEKKCSGDYPIIDMDTDNQLYCYSTDRQKAHKMGAPDQRYVASEGQWVDVLDLT